MGIRLEQIKVTFKDTEGKAVPVLDIPEFSVPKGSRLCILGGSGEYYLPNVGSAGSGKGDRYSSIAALRTEISYHRPIRRILIARCSTVSIQKKFDVCYIGTI